MKKTKLFSFFFALLMFLSISVSFVHPAQAASKNQVTEGSVLKRLKKVKS